jgi:chitodextrinase
VPQPGNTPDARGYHVLPAFFDMESWNFEYSHKDSSNYPWESFGAGGLYECPYHVDHGASYSAHVHMDAQFPGDFHQGLFNGVHVTTQKYWLTGNRDYWVNLEFLTLTGPAECIEATAVFASGDMSTGQWGNCGTTPNEGPVASFSYACTDLDCTFDGNGSSDPDGTVNEYIWEFGDGTSAAGAVAGHGYAIPGTYAVLLTVTDDDGATGSSQQNVTVEVPGSGEITATVSTNRKRNRIAVRWSGAVGNGVDIYRNGQLAVSTSNDGGWNDRNVSTGNFYAYRVCESGSDIACSDEATIDL